MTTTDNEDEREDGMTEFTSGDYTVRVTSVRGEHRLTCTCGWTNVLYATETSIPDWAYAHLRAHNRERETRET